MISQTESESAVAVQPFWAGGKEGLAGHGPLIRDSLGYLMSKVVPGFFGLISVPVFVRLLGVREYGRLSVILPVLMALGGAGSGWLQQGILRFHPASELSPETESPFAQAVTLGTALAAVALGLVLLPVMGVLHYRASLWVIAEAYCAVQLVYMVSLTCLQAQLRPRAVLRNEALRTFTGFILPVCLILGSGRRAFSLIILGLALGYLLPLLFTRGRLSELFHVHRFLGAGSGFEVRKILGQLWRFGWAIGLWLMLCQALPVVGRTAIQRYAGYAQAGIYASLYDLAVRSFSLFASPVLQAAHPRIMRCWNAGDYGAARATIRHSILLQILIFLPIEALGVMFAGPLTRLILGPGNVVSNSLLPLLMLGGFLWQIAHLVHKPLEIMQRTKTMLCGMLGVLLIEFSGNYLLVPRFGMQSVVYVFLLGAIAYIVFAALYGRISLQHPGSAPAASSL
jgi:O-antigen/teichoic acid export membrane protein